MAKLVVRLLALAAGAAIVWGCQSKSPPTHIQGSNVDVGGIRPAPGDSTSTATPTPMIPRFGPLGLTELGYLVANNSAGLSGNVSAPASLISNNSAGLISNNSAGLISNNSAGVISNNSAGLTGAGNYRLASLSSNVVSGFVYFTDAQERLYVNPDRQLISTLTDAAGNFTVTAPATNALIVDVLLSGDRRLTALADTSSGGNKTVNVSLATTLVTEFLRLKTKEYGFALATLAGISGAMEEVQKLVSDTDSLLTSDRALSSIKSSDLILANLPLLCQHYVVAFGTATDHTVSDDWVSLLRLIKNDYASPDARYRSLAITVIDAGVPSGMDTMGVTVDTSSAASGTIYLSDADLSQGEIRSLAPDGTETLLLTKERGDYDGTGELGNPASLTALADGRVVLADSDTTSNGAPNNVFWVGLLDPRKALPPGNVPFLEATDSSAVLAKWTNPSLLLNTYVRAVDQGNPASSNFIGNDDIAFDDTTSGGQPDPNMYFVDSTRNSLWVLSHALKAAGPLATPVLLAPATGSTGLVASTSVAVAPAAPDSRALSQLFFNLPIGVTFHRHNGVPYLYIADSGSQVFVEVSLASGTARRVVGKLPDAQGNSARAPQGYTSGEEGALPLTVNLNGPRKALFDSKERMILADTGNRLIRIASLYSDQSYVYSIAGLAQNAGKDSIGLPPVYAAGEGEARHVAIGDVWAIALDGDGNLLMSDWRSNKLRKLWLSFLK